MNDLFFRIDIGTTPLKAAIFDRTGAQPVSAVVECSLLTQEASGVAGTETVRPLRRREVLRNYRAGEFWGVLAGGSKSDIWNQAKADITGKTLQVTCSSRDTACLDVAILTDTATGLFESIESAADSTVKIEKPFSSIPPVTRFVKSSTPGSSCFSPPCTRCSIRARRHDCPFRRGTPFIGNIVPETDGNSPGREMIGVPLKSGETDKRRRVENLPAPPFVFTL